MPHPPYPTMYMRLCTDSHFWQPHSHLRDATHIISHWKFVEVVVLEIIVVGRCRLEIWDMGEVLVSDHSFYMLWLNGLTWFMMYLRKTQLEHIPIIMVVWTDTSSICMYIYDPERIDCMPISLVFKSSLYLPITSDTVYIIILTSLPVTFWGLPFAYNILQ